MKKLTECKKCHSNYDAFLRKCPYCNERNIEFPLNKKFNKMLFLTDYKDILMFLFGFLFLQILAFLFNVALKNAPMDKFLLLSLTNFLSYFFTAAVICCIISYDFPYLIKPFKKIRPLIVGLIGVAIVLAFSFSYQGILKACNVSIINSDNQKTTSDICKNYPALAFFTICVIAPFVEECCYRLGLFSVLRKKNRYLAYGVTIIVFTLIHFNFFSTNLVNECLNLPLYVVPAIVLTLTYEYEGYSASFYTHFINNIISFIIIMAI